MKKTYIKQLVIIFLSVILLAALTLLAHAETINGSCGENLTWSFNTDTGVLRISGTGEMGSGQSMPWNSFHLDTKKVVIEDGVTSIAEQAFFAFNMTSVIIPDTVTRIGKRAFSDCYNLKNVTFGNRVKTIGYAAFDHCLSLRCEIPASVTSIGDSAFCMTRGITVNKQNPWYSSENGDLLSKDKTVLYQHLGDNDSEYIVPETVTTIKSYAVFSYSLTNVVLHENVLKVEAYGVCSYILETVTIRGMNTILDEDYSLAPAMLRFQNVPKELRRDIAYVLFGWKEPSEAIQPYINYASSYVTEWEETDPFFGTIICHAGSTAETYARSIGMSYQLEHFYDQFVSITPISEAEKGFCTMKCINCNATQNSYYVSSSLRDNLFGVSILYDTGAFDGEITLSVAEVTGSNDLTSAYTKLSAWDIVPLLNGNKVQPNEPVIVSLPIPEDYDNTHIAVYHVDYDGKADRIKPIFIYDEMAIFAADLFSVYVVVDESCSHVHDFSASVIILENATCTTEGRMICYCACGESDEQLISAQGHDIINHSAKAPTCTAIGWDAYQTCSRCDYTSYEEIAALGHDYINHDAQAPTCTEIGWDAYETCSRCDYTTYTEKDALGHSPSSTVIENEIKADCGKNGSYEEVVYCETCKQELSRNMVTTDALDHTDDNNDGHCDRCGEQMTGGDHCKYCGQIHGGAFGWLVRFFHSILAFFKR